MKVVSRREPPIRAPWWLGQQWTCERCASVLQVERAADVRWGRVLKVIPVAHVTCAVCEHEQMLAPPPRLPPGTPDG